MTTSITRRANTINLHMLANKETGDKECSGSVTISDQVIGENGWWIDSKQPETEAERLPLIPTGNGSFAYPDANGEIYNLTVAEHFATFNKWFKLLLDHSKITPATPVKSKSTGKLLENQWSLGAEPFLRITNIPEKRYYVIRPILYKSVNAPETEEPRRRLLISIHNVFVQSSLASEDW